MSLVDNDSGVFLVLGKALGRVNFDSVFGKVKVNYPNNRQNAAYFQQNPF